jgi:hypothetical protein
MEPGSHDTCDTQSLASRQVDALLIARDVLVLTAADRVVHAERGSVNPGISVMPPNAR